MSFRCMEDYLATQHTAAILAAIEHPSRLLAYLNYVVQDGYHWNEASILRRFHEELAVRQHTAYQGPVELHGRSFSTGQENAARPLRVAHRERRLETSRGHAARPLRIAAQERRVNANPGHAARPLRVAHQERRLNASQRHAARLLHLAHQERRYEGQGNIGHQERRLGDQGNIAHQERRLGSQGNIDHQERRSESRGNTDQGNVAHQYRGLDMGSTEQRLAMLQASILEMDRYVAALQDLDHDAIDEFDERLMSHHTAFVNQFL